MARQSSRSYTNEERLRFLNIWLKSIVGVFLNSLLYFCAWIWLIIPIFPTLPLIGYWVWFGIEILRGKIKSSEWVGVKNTSVELAPGKDRWVGFILGYGVIFLILWLCSLSVSSTSSPIITLIGGG